MRIGCLQFAPRVGDVDNNLNRADAVLSRADPLDLDELDLLVLPELAFSGYNFKSLREITPYLEPSGSGISSLWARTTALKYNCTVAVGYPEKVDVSKIWPTGPEFYNSSIVVNGEGETVANYRKTFLYPTDETWALEGKDGFFHDTFPGLGKTVMGICMDMNPYKFEAPWNAFEFGFHILKVKAELVIISMAWMTSEDSRIFTRQPQEPDMESLTYWVQRLEPLIRTEDEKEVIVVFCNRSGSEGEAIYSGTSAVVGIKGGEVSVYGLLGRGNKELLFVDTDLPPFAKLVQRLEIQGDEAVPNGHGRRMSSSSSTVASTVPSTAESNDSAYESTVASTAPSLESPGLPRVTFEDREKPEAVIFDEGLWKPENFRPGVPRLETNSDASKLKDHLSPSTPSAMSVPSPASSGLRSPLSPASSTASGRRKPRPKSPKIQIPYTPSLDEISSAPLSTTSSTFSFPGSMISPGIPTPSGPDPQPMHLRPQIGEPPLSPATYEHKVTPFPGAEKWLAESLGLLDPTADLGGETPTSPPILPGFTHVRDPSSRKDTPIEPGYSPLPFSPLSPWSATSPYVSRPSHKPLSSQLAISAMMAQMRSPVRMAGGMTGGIIGGMTPRPSIFDPSRDAVETPSTAVPRTADPLTALPLTALPLTAVPMSAAPVTAFPVTAVATGFPHAFPEAPKGTNDSDPVKDRSRTPKPNEHSPYSSPPPHHRSTTPDREPYPREQTTPKQSFASIRPMKGTSSVMYPPIADPVVRPKTTLPIRNVKSDEELAPTRRYVSTKGVIPIVASPSIFNTEFGAIARAFSDPEMPSKTTTKGRRAQSQTRPTLTGRERRMRSRSVSDSSNDVPEFKHLRSSSTSPVYVRG